MHEAQSARMAKRGRPTLALADRLRVSVWSHLVLLASGLNEIQELEALFASMPGLWLSSGLWSRYMRGKVIPQGALDASQNTTLVHRVEKFLPGTADLFFSPVWTLLAWEPKVDFEMLKQGYISLGEGVTEQFVDDEYLDSGKGVHGHGHFWYCRRPIEDTMTVIDRLDVWDQLVAYLLESRMSYAAQDQNSFTYWQLLACKALATLQERPEFQEKQLHSVFLTMEFMCLLTVAVNNDGANWLPTKLDLQRIDWVESWNRRVNRHLRRLSDKSRTDFVDTIKEAQRHS